MSAADDWHGAIKYSSGLQPVQLYEALWRQFSPLTRACEHQVPHACQPPHGERVGALGHCQARDLSQTWAQQQGETADSQHKVRLLSVALAATRMQGCCCHYLVCMLQLMYVDLMQQNHYAINRKTAVTFAGSHVRKVQPAHLVL
jgi:hypothetical protein